MTITPQRQAGQKKQPAKNWDLKLAAVLFVGTCATMSLILPSWQQARTESLMDRSTAVAAPAPRPTETRVQPTIGTLASAAAATIPQGQRRAAMQRYESGQKRLQQGDYAAAATAFKQALEKSPELAEAYIGLGDAFNRLGDYTAAENNARHALSQLKLLKSGQAPDPERKRELSYAHQVLGIALLHRAKGALHEHQATIGRMKALEAASHCNLATVFDRNDTLAQDCAQQAARLAAHS